MSVQEFERTLTPEQHRRLAAQLFNHVWTLMETAQRTPEQDLQMIHQAHASRFHWGEVGLPANLARGEWQISRVYSVLERPEPAILHAQRCLEHCLTAHLSDFDVAFAHEALSRAHSIAGQAEEAERHRRFAEAAGARIADADDRRLLLADLATIGAG